MEDYPVLEDQQQDQQQLDSLLVKLQLELQQQLQPQQQDDTAADADTRVVARLTAVDQHASAAAAPAGDDDAAAAGAAAADSAAAAPVEAEAAADAAAAAPAEAASPSPARAPSDRALSGTEEDWHLVSRGTSVKAASSTGRCSFEGGSVSPAPGSASPFFGAATDASECGSDATPRDDLAASILGHPVMLAASAAEAAGAGATCDSVRSSITLHPADSGHTAALLQLNPAAAAPGDGDAPPQSGGDAATAAGVDDDAGGLLPASVGPGEALSLLSSGLLQLAGAAQARAADGLDGLREWLVESLAALVQGGRGAHGALSARAQAALTQLQLAAKQQGGGLAAAAAAAAGDWRLLLSSAAAVVCLALWMRSRKEATLLRAMLRRRDHELSKLVMRVVSLQELLNQGGHLAPISSSSSASHGSHSSGGALRTYSSGSSHAGAAAAASKTAATLLFVGGGGGSVAAATCL